MERITNSKTKKVSADTYFEMLDKTKHVSYLKSWEERICYASALCLAIEWGNNH